MRVILASVGTDGDVFPYVGLGAVLRSRGHQIALAASANYESLAVLHGFDFRPLVSEEERQELLGNPDFWNPLKTAPLCARWGVRLLPKNYDVLAKLTTDNTVLVANPGVLAAGLIHEKHRLPWVSLVLQPWMIPSSTAPPLMPGLTLLGRAPAPVWRLFWRALNFAGDILVGRSLNRLRASLGLKPQRRIFENWLSPQLVLGLFPEWYGPPQADWPPQMRLTGFPMFDGGQGEDLSPRLLEFCRAGTPPVAFTFGTGMAHSAALFRAALEASEVLGVRGIFLTKFKDQLPDSLPPSILHSDFAPFQKLFPHCAAVVHHGGVGTVAKAMAAGTPQLICPLCFDQMDNGARAKKLGVGDWLNSRNRNGRQMAGALTKLMSLETKSRCDALALRFGASNALATAAQFIEGFAEDKFHAKKPNSRKET
jgi:UDP:flavonoid glycosyltransferase YjiC (YdhE family)